MIEYQKDIRFGYGLIKGQADTNKISIPKNKVDLYPKLTPTIESLPEMVNGRSHYSKLAKAGDTEGYKKAVSEYYKNNRKLYVKNAIERIKFTTRSHYGFFERLVYFWENHLAIMTANKTSYSLSVAGYENEVIRPNVDGYFHELLSSAATHPAMLITLEQHMSMGKYSPTGLILNRGSNENFARELLELHSLGAKSGYLQKDVEEMAELLTGLSVNYNTGETDYFPSRATNGKFNILGKTYGGIIKTRSDIMDAIYDLALNPSTAEFISQKLARHFISDIPPENLTEKLKKRFIETDGFLPALYEILLDFKDDNVRFEKIKTPLDYIVTALRTIGVPKLAFENIQTFDLHKTSMMEKKSKIDSRLPDLTIGALDAMGHRLWGTPGPDGWPDTNQDWLHSVAIAQRFSWASAIAPIVKENGLELLDNALGQFASSETRKLIANSTSHSEAVILTLMSPEFNRR